MNFELLSQDDLSQPVPLYRKCNSEQKPCLSTEARPTPANVGSGKVLVLCSCDARMSVGGLDS